MDLSLNFYNYALSISTHFAYCLIEYANLLAIKS